MPAREPLNRSRILEAACAVADADGLGAVSMRTVAARLGVEAMSLYHHVGNKEAMLDGMVDAVFAEFHQPRVGGDWTEEMRKRSRSARQALKRHPWAVGLMDSRRSAGLETLRHHDAVLGCLRTAGFSLTLAGHAFALLDAHLYGFLVQELSLPFQGEADLAALATEIMTALPAGELPHFREFVVDHALRPGYVFGDEFDVGLDLVLDGLAERLAAEP
ncbi:MAG: TetR family transcriptional regulator [Nocardioidaceae bacterium]|nr:TetR family transcriptional regulator [Nocardioidaceae bacterium]NUS51373.1 TetR family transcriptional regulator [Nocardioidaceae bacterium]